MNQSQAGSPMPKYRSHKEEEVWALKIGDSFRVNPDGSFTFSVADGGFAPLTVCKDVVARFVPSDGDYYVRYENGYESFSPAKTFEEGYKRI